MPRTATHMTTPPQRWRGRAEVFLTNWSEPHKTNMLAALARENDLAESLGFEYEPDPRRGHGWGRFSSGTTEVWETASDGRVWWMRIERSVRYKRATHHCRYNTLEDALRRRNPTHKLGLHYMWEPCEDTDAPSEISSS